MSASWPVVPVQRAVVGPDEALAVVGLDHEVGVDVVEVQEQQQRPPAAGGEHLAGEPQDAATAVRDRAVLEDLEHVAEALEALVETVALGDVVRVDHRRGLVPRGGQRRGQGRHVVRESAGVLLQAVAAGVEAGQQRGVGRQGPRGGRGDVLEHGTRGRQAVEGGGRVAVVAIAAQAVGPQGVDRDEQHVRGPARFRAAGRDERRDREDGRTPGPGPMRSGAGRAGLEGYGHELAILRGAVRASHGAHGGWDALDGVRRPACTGAGAHGGRRARGRRGLGERRPQRAAGRVPVAPPDASEPVGSNSRTLLLRSKSRQPRRRSMTIASGSNAAESVPRAV